MALRALVQAKKISMKKKELEEARTAAAELEKRQAELETAIEEAATDEEQQTVEESVNDFETEMASARETISSLENEISELEAELDNIEAEQDTVPAEREMKTTMSTRERFFGMDMQERDAFFARPEVQDYLGEIRAHIKEKRALSNVGVTIPEVMLGVLKANIENYSKLYKHVTTMRVNGTGRALIMGNYDEAIWTECCANLNELTLAFYDLELDCFMVGGYYAVCNANLEDSDIALATEILTAIGQAIGVAIDKAILYGRNTSSNQKMPLGIVSRLAQTEKPSGYPQTARPWVDLHTSNILSIASGTTGAALISAIALDAGAAKGKYSRGEKVWCMNEKTYTALGAATVTTAADGSIVSSVLDRMPVVGGVIEVLDFIPDNVIIGGYFDTYILAERAGNEFATSEHVRFLQNQTVMKGTARYDGAPRIAEAFVAIGINGTTPTAAMTFAADTANTGA